MNIKPLKDRVLLKPLEHEPKTEGGLYLPDTAKDDKVHEAEVVAVGESKDSLVKAGQKVLFESFAGTEIKVKGQRYLLVDIKDVLAVVE